MFYTYEYTCITFHVQDWEGWSRWSIFWFSSSSSFTGFLHQLHRSARCEISQWSAMWGIQWWSRVKWGRPNPSPSPGTGTKQTGQTEWVSRWLTVFDAVSLTLSEVNVFSSSLPWGDAHCLWRQPSNEKKKKKWHWKAHMSWPTGIERMESNKHAGRFCPTGADFRCCRASTVWVQKQRGGGQAGGAQPDGGWLWPVLLRGGVRHRHHDEPRGAEGQLWKVTLNLWLRVVPQIYLMTLQRGPTPRSETTGLHHLNYI